MEDLIGKWGWISIDEIQTEHFKKFIHPEYSKNLEHHSLTDYVFLCLNNESNNYLKVKSTEIELLVKQEIFRVMPKNPDFEPLQKVKFLNSKGCTEFGIIKKISWHNNNQKHIYFLEVNGKMKTRRYYAEDLKINE